MMRSVNRETMLTNNQHNQLAVTRKKSREPDIILVFFLYKCWVGCRGVKFWLPSICPTAPLSLLSLSVTISPYTLRSRLLGFLAEHRDRRKEKKKKNRRSNPWRTSLLKCATFYFSANYPHAVHRLKAVLWLSLQLSKAATMTHNAAGVSQLQGEAEFFRVLTVICRGFFFAFYRLIYFHLRHSHT